MQRKLQDDAIARLRTALMAAGLVV